MRDNRDIKWQKHLKSWKFQLLKFSYFLFSGILAYKFKAIEVSFFFLALAK